MSTLRPPPPRSQPPVDPTTGVFTSPWYRWLSALYQGVKQAVLTVAGVYLPTFQAGYIQYAGPNSTLAANTNLLFGLAIPNPSGTPSPALLIGSGVPQAWIVTDTWADILKAGVNLGITAGETAVGSSQSGGQLWLIGGASDLGTGGPLLAQGGTSASGPGGPATLQGGNSTNGPAGDAFVVGGENGIAGANVQLIMTKVNGIAGLLRIRVNSTILIEVDQNGTIYLAGNPGSAGQKLTSQGPGLPAVWA